MANSIIYAGDAGARGRFIQETSSTPAILYVLVFLLLFIANSSDGVEDVVERLECHNNTHLNCMGTYLLWLPIVILCS